MCVWHCPLARCFVVFLGIDQLRDGEDVLLQNILIIVKFDLKTTKIYMLFAPQPISYQLII